MALCTTLLLSTLCGCASQPGAAGITRLSGTGEDTDSQPGGSSRQADDILSSNDSGQSGPLSDSGSRLGGPLSSNGSGLGGPLSGSNPGQDGSLSAPSSGQDALHPADAASATDFAVRLFQQNLLNRKTTRDNVLISPISVLYALSMTANGANGQTLAQMEEVLGASVSELNAYLHEYRTSLPENDDCRLRLANSIWFRDDERFTVNEDFLAQNEAWYNADIYKAPFDSSTVKAVNNWVSDATDKMIPQILDEIPPDAVMYLINGLAFDAKWETVYEKYDVRKGDFTDEDGDTCQTEMMYSSESLYLQDEQAQGFLKYYKDKKYAFAALLPNEGISVADYAASLDGSALHEMLSNPVHTSISAAIPKFETEYSKEMNELFDAMGMTDAFDSTVADLSGIGSSTAGNLYISRILHKTYIAVDELGTKAGAVTSVEIKDECAPLIEHQIYLNRPFVYMIIDCEENVPVFMGTLMSVK